MEWDAEQFHAAFTEWILGELEKRGIKHAAFSRQAAIDTRKDGRAFRRAKSGGRQWKVSDLCNIANTLEMSPAEVLENVQKHYKHKFQK
jgi:hypothetical protein